MAGSDGERRGRARSAGRDHEPKQWPGYSFEQRLFYGHQCAQEIQRQQECKYYGRKYDFKGVMWYAILIITPLLYGVPPERAWLKDLAIKLEGRIREWLNITPASTGTKRKSNARRESPWT